MNIEIISDEVKTDLEIKNQIEENTEKNEEEKIIEVEIENNDEAKIEREEQDVSIIEVAEENIRESRKIKLTDSEIDMIETALEIRYSSLKLERFPVEETTIKTIINQIVVRSFGVTDIKIEDDVIKGVHIKILKINNINYLEFKTREFKLGLEIDLREDWSFTVVERNYYYKVYTNRNFIRIKVTLNLLKKIFGAKKLEFFNKKLSGSLVAENRIVVMKLELLLKELDELKSNNKEKLLNLDNNFYTLSLLNLIETTEMIESWINFKCDMNKIDIQAGDSLVVERIHKLDGNKFDIKEIIEIIAPISEQEIKDSEIKGYRKNCKIYLERLYKKRG